MEGQHRKEHIWSGKQNTGRQAFSFPGMGCTVEAENYEGPKHTLPLAIILMASNTLQLDFEITGPVFTANLPPVSAISRKRNFIFMHRSPENSGNEDLSQREPNFRYGECQSCSAEEQLELWWRGFFSDPTRWWDNRWSKKTPRYPDFGHNKFKDALRLYDPHKPRVESQLATWGSPSTSVQEGLGRLAAHDADSEVKAWRKQCENGQISVGVDALNHLVQRGCHVHYKLFYRVLKRCIAQKNLVLGRRIHALTVQSGYDGHAFLATHLIGLYASHGRLEEAIRVFERVPAPDVYNWATIIVAYARHGEANQAIQLYRQMCGSSVKPDNHIFSAVLKACASAGDLDAGKDVHAHVLASAGKPDIFVQTCLVDMYAKCGSLEDARSVFDKLPHRDVVMWTAMIAGYAQQGMAQEALRLYSAMQQEDIIPPDSVTFLSLLQACATVAALPLGKQLHAQIEELGLQADEGVGNALVNMYAKCGSIADAHQVFDSLPERDIVAWGALIAGYTRHGHSEVVFDLVDRMVQEGKQPNSITFLSLLTVCCHVGFVDKGRKYFEAMRRDYGIHPTIEHYTCMVDILGRAGQLDEALRIVKSMPFQSDGTVWSTLLGACRKWSNVEVGRQAFELAVRQDEKNAGAYVLMSDTYASAEMWEEAKEIQARRVKSGACKPPGQSWCTDMGGLVHTFGVGDN